VRGKKAIVQYLERTAGNQIYTYEEFKSIQLMAFFSRPLSVNLVILKYIKQWFLHVVLYGHESLLVLKEDCGCSKTEC
jgi:hypothetical protein